MLIEPRPAKPGTYRRRLQAEIRDRALALAHAAEKARPSARMRVPLLAELAPIEPPSRSERCDALQRAVERVFGLTTEALLAKNRRAAFVHPRRLLMYLMRVDAGASLSLIAARLDLDHTTVLHHCRVVATRLGAGDAAIAAQVAAIRAAIVAAGRGSAGPGRAKAGLAP